jgi:hypothetical protein
VPLVLSLSKHELSVLQRGPRGVTVARRGRRDLASSAAAMDGVFLQKRAAKERDEIAPTAATSAG